MELEKIHQLLQSETVRLWTIEDLTTWKEAEKRGELRTDGRKHHREFEHEPLQWLRAQMKERIPGYTGRYPCWAWAEKPNLRTYRGYADAGTECVRIEFEMPREKVVFFDESTVLCVLVPDYVSVDQADEDRFLRLCIKYAKAPNAGRTEKIKKMIEDSWQRIFDFDLLANTYWCTTEDGLYVQAIMEGVPIEAVKKVDHFIAR